MKGATTLVKGSSYNDSINPFPFCEPVEGMFVGKGSYQSLNISLWVRGYCFEQNKGCRQDSSSSGQRKVWLCTDKMCPWKLSISRKDDNVW